MPSFSALTDRSAVQAAIDEFDRLGRDASLRTNGFAVARDYFLAMDSGRYDSKAIFGVAYRVQHRMPLGYSLTGINLQDGWTAEDDI